MGRREVTVGLDSLTVFFHGEIRTVLVFIKAAERKMHFGVPRIQPQRLLVFQQRRLKLTLLGERAGKVGMGDSIGRV